MDAGAFTNAMIIARNVDHDTSGGGDLLFFNRKDDSNADSSSLSMIIENTGDVGIGTNNPDTKLVVAGAFQGNASDTMLNTAGIHIDDTTAWADLHSSKPTGGGINFSGLYGDDEGQVIFAGIRGLKENNTDNNYDGALLFGTIANGGNISEKMRIDSSGKVGIGTNNPGNIATQSTLEVKATAAFLGLTSTAGNNSSGIEFGDTDDGNIGQIHYYHGDNSMNFTTNTGVAMTIDSSQNVGIGNTAPPSALTVTGVISGSSHIKSGNGAKIYSHQGYGKIKGNDGTTTSGAENTPHTESIDMPEGSHILTVMMHRTEVHILGTYMIACPPNASNVVNCAVVQLSYHAYGSTSQIDVQNQNNSTNFGFNASSDGIIKIIYTNDDSNNWQYWSWSYTTLGTLLT
jgi:hypothetical protein